MSLLDVSLYFPSRIATVDQIPRPKGSFVQTGLRMRTCPIFIYQVVHLFLCIPAYWIRTESELQVLKFSDFTLLWHSFGMKTTLLGLENSLGLG